MDAMASQITSLTIVFSTVFSDADQRKHPSSASLAFVRGIHRGPVNFPHKWPVTRKMFPFVDVLMSELNTPFRHCLLLKKTQSLFSIFNILTLIVSVSSPEVQVEIDTVYGIILHSIWTGKHCDDKSPVPSSSLDKQLKSFLTELVLIYCQLNPLKHTPTKVWQFWDFVFTKRFQMTYLKCRPFSSIFNVFTYLD